MKKNIILLVISILVIVGIITVSYSFGDRKLPQIEVNSTPKLSCSCGFDDLIEYASARDDNSIKSLLVEEKDINSVISSKKVTYVAIDSSDNVSKLKVPVQIDDEYTTYHIESIKKPTLQLGTKFNISDYFVLKNECGVEIDGRLKMTAISNNKLGEYDVKVESASYDVKPLYTKFTVIDERVPVITLTKDEIEYSSNSYWTIEDFTGIIDELYDDEDDIDYLLERMQINWEDVLNPDSNGYVTKVGKYEVAYTVTDSDNNVGKAKVLVNLTAPIVVQEQEVTE